MIGKIQVIVILTLLMAITINLKRELVNLGYVMDQHLNGLYVIQLMVIGLIGQNILNVRLDQLVQKNIPMPMLMGIGAVNILLIMMVQF